MIFKPPYKIEIPAEHAGKKTIFLAGSIEMGVAEDWQTRVANELGESFVIFNPRRENWDSSWRQEFENPQFREQVEWELNGLEKADIVLMYFAPGSKSPISLLEFGLYARSKKMIVCCPQGFWRKGNVDVTCNYYGVTQVDTIEELIATIKSPQIAQVTTD
ncbi:MAG TPA: nucleoside 2-deoxyribosyltransferase domain-containing protein [Flavobacteriales bacterium]|nr:nucleoside 2-deoxyribosyltransferase domain-containing protein [Flavobacteriales bacterium]